MMVPALRKPILTLHVLTSVGLVGTIAAFLVLAVWGFVTQSELEFRTAYLTMGVITYDLIVPLAIVSLLVGVAQSLVSPWGLVRYYWIIVKLVLTIIAVVVLLLQTPTIYGLAEYARASTIPDLQEARASMVVHSAGGILVLLTAIVLSVFKPKGLTAYGARRAAERRPA